VDGREAECQTRDCGDYHNCRHACRRLGGVGGGRVVVGERVGVTSDSRHGRLENEKTHA